MIFKIIIIAINMAFSKFIMIETPWWRLRPQTEEQQNNVLYNQNEKKVK
ncbi:hypothetical protein XNC1_1958 [Xenorhabdus nematophila ATCC 19061]|uniref:Uncharacterized protein n=1 Tax=Xenorhabdus nematophila (strain ATCC 19061 / DSM 3370 / CCUG 14189 / LMG 1036 / NCIMB 9965 / AN6) TaxID=406817 RepID=D3VDV1_XENNA|nr:hypothetical protein XNC1_1958 [Xenorhabdus nematophila ATCC 19061]